MSARGADQAADPICPYEDSDSESLPSSIPIQKVWPQCWIPIKNARTRMNIGSMTRLDMRLFSLFRPWTRLLSLFFSIHPRRILLSFGHSMYSSEGLIFYIHAGIPSSFDTLYLRAPSQTWQAQWHPTRAPGIVW